MVGMVERIPPALQAIFGTVADEAAGISWISRVPAGLTLRTDDAPSQPVHEFLAEQPAEVRRIDTWLWIGGTDNGGQPLRCRFLAVRCPSEVAARRRRRVEETARRKGRAVSRRQLALCGWTVATEIEDRGCQPRL